MVYDEKLADRVRPMMSRRKGIAEKKMFGGVGFLLHGNMCVGVWKKFLILRLGLNKYEAALEEPFTKEFDITGRVMRGWVMVDQKGLADDDDIKTWIEKAARFVRTLPKK